MKVILVGSKRGFTASEGFGVKRYMYELKNHLEKMPGIEVLALERKNPILPVSINEKDMDLVHVLDAIPVKRPKDVPLIYTCHDFHPFTVPELNPYDYKTVKGLLGLNLSLFPGYKSTLRSDAIICNSTQTRQEAIGLGFDPKRAYVSNHGIDERFIKRTISKQPLDAKFRVGYIGALSTTKNVGFTIRAFKLLKETSIQFDIWGLKQEAYKELKALAGNDRRINFMGFAPEKDIVGIYDSFDVFVHPTLYEGFCLPILEAQARGLPVLTYSKALIPKEVRRYCIETENEEDMAQRIEELMKKGYSEKKRNLAKEYARKFTWATNAKETAAIYRKILADYESN